MHNTVLANRYCVEIRLVEPPPNLNVTIDPIHMRKVLDNLLANALRFSHSGGVVKLFVRQCLDCIRIIVSDLRIGMANDMKDEVFQMASKDSELGTGSVQILPRPSWIGTAGASA